LIAVRLGPWLAATSREFDFQSPGPCRVARVVDGDTLLMDGNIAVRLIGVDTADGKHPSPAFGPQAVEFSRRRVEGRDVTLQLDRERRDPNGRILAYVYADGSMLNEELIRAGFSRADTSFNLDRPTATRFRRAEDEARQAGRGIWQGSSVSARGSVSAR
jgi:micrococcal nuclease